MRRSCDRPRQGRMKEPAAAVYRFREGRSRRRSGSRRRGRCGCSGGRPSGSILRRRLATWARRTWRSSSYSTPQTSTSRLRWVISRPRLSASVRSSSNSVGVRWTSSPSRRTLRAARSISIPSALDHRLARLGPGPPQRGLEPGDQLRRPERLRHVVVGAGRERPHLLLLLADRGEDDDRHLAPLAQPLGHLDAVDVGQHQVEDRRRRRAAPRRASSASSPLLVGDRLVAGVAEDHPQRAEDLRLVVADEDPRRLAQGPSPAAASKETTKAEPWPGSDSIAIVAAVGLDEPLGDREAEAGAAAGAVGRARRARRSAPTRIRGSPGPGRRRGR